MSPLRLLSSGFLAALLAIAIGADAQTLTQPVFGLPSCANYKYQVPVSTESAGLKSETAGQVFCTSNDFAGSTSLSAAPLSQFAAVTNGRSVRALVVSAYTYADVAAARWICSLPYSPQASITLLAQRTASGSGRVSDEFQKALSACSVTPHFVYYGCDVFEGEDGGGAQGCTGGAANMLHLKTLHIEFADNTAAVLVGSGNFNRSLFANIEDWLLHVAPVGSTYLAAAPRCFASALIDNSSPSPSPRRAEDSYRRCLSTWPDARRDAGVTLRFAPFEGEEHRKRLLEAVAKAEALDVAAQELEDPQLIAAILANKAAHVRIVLDDDWYFALRNEADFHTADFDKAKWVKGLDPSKYRFLQTNHTNAGGTGNTLHTRLIIVTAGGVRTVFTGSAHLRAGSFRLNAEHLLEITDAQITPEYSGFFERLWQRAVPWGAMPMIDAPIVLTN